MPTKLLLLQDVEYLGRKGQVVATKRGYAHNFLVPQGFALVASPHVLRQQTKLQEDRKKEAEKDLKEAEDIARRLEGEVIPFQVKVDHDGHMYGSVSVLDIIEAIKLSTGVELEKKSIPLKHPIKKTGVYELTLRLKEDVLVHITLKILSEQDSAAAAAATVAETVEEAPQEE